MTNEELSFQSPEDNRYVLRLVVVKVEGVLFPDPANWPSNWANTKTHDSFDPDQLFPEWADQLDLDSQTLRDELKNLASSGELELNEPVRTLLNDLKNHTPIRVALLSGGPSEWVNTLLDEYRLSDVNDLAFCYDNYTHGTRRTLLQFLMNRFIAGKGRTLLLGNTSRDETIAEREDTRFRSLSEPPDNALNPEHWNWSVEELKEYMHRIKAED